jgi:hypothetical protein
MPIEHLLEQCRARPRHCNHKRHALHRIGSRLEEALALLQQGNLLSKRTHPFLKLKRPRGRRVHFAREIKRLAISTGLVKKPDRFKPGKSAQRPMAI